MDHTHAENAEKHLANEERHTCSSCKHCIAGQDYSYSWAHYQLRQLYYLDYEVFLALASTCAISKYIESYRCIIHFDSHWNFLTGTVNTHKPCKDYNEDGYCKDWKCRELKPESKKSWFARWRNKNEKEIR